MSSTAALPDSLRELIRAQAGAVSAEQCRLAGLSAGRVRGLVDRGLWVRAGKGPLVTHACEWSVATRQWLAVLAAGERAALGLETAAALQGWGASTDSVMLVVPATQRAVQPGDWSVLRTRTPFQVVGQPPRTTVERTALDLVRRDPDRAISILTEVVNSRRTTTARLLAELGKFASFPRRELVRGVLGDVGLGALSVLEMMWLRDVERAHGLPRGERQTRSRAGYRDIRYGSLLVELDGKLGHTGMGAFRDMDRDNLHALSGETTLRFGFADVDRRPCACAAQTAVALRMLGQPVDPISCRRGCVEAEALLDRPP